MNKYAKIIGIAFVLAASLALIVVVAGAFAQGPPDSELAIGNGQMRHGNESDTGLGVRAVDEADMHAAIAGALGMTVDDFEAAVAEGKTPYLLATEMGVDFAEIQAAMAALHDAALEQAVADGIITQERANMMLNHGAGNGHGADESLPAPGNMGRGGGNMAQESAHQGGFGGECPNVTP